MKNTTQQSLLKVAAVVVGLCISLLAMAQTIDRAEYFWDDDPGYGNATTLTITAGGTVGTDVPLPAPATPGSHLLGLRYHGNKGWSATITQYVTVPAAETVSILQAEYFWDDDPGYGHATTLLVNPGSSVTTETLAALSGNPAPGEHLLGLRYRGTNGWSPTVTQYVRVPQAETVSILAAEFFWDDDPGFGQGTTFIVTPGSSIDISQLLSASGLPAGEHQLFVRYRGTQGWSPTICSDVFVAGSDCAILAAEYFWNEDPGFGHGTPISITPGQEITLNDFGAPSFTVHGDATLFIRYRGTNGWSPTVSQLVMVDAEGHYTLNANGETSMEARNYQSLTDAFSDFYDRGIGNSIEMEVTTKDTTYELDATADGLLSYVQQAAQNLEALSTNSDTKTITFTAAEGSGNVVSITATTLSDVMPLLSRIATQNVTLLVNGTEMDFTALTQRQQTVCPDAPTVSVDLSTIGGGITAVFTAQPAANSVLSGFAAEAAGILPAMTIENSGIVTDSVAYAVTLSHDGQTVYSYTYYIYAHASMTHQTISGMTPATGSSLNPGTVTLSWDALQNVEGYLLTVTDVTAPGAPSTVLDGLPVEASHHSRQFTAETGHRYQWQVTALGPCDELQSPVMTFEGRLLPDLAVTAITLPEAAQGGNLLTVHATITNQGEGSTTEQPWTDRLYYVLDGTDYAQAVEAADVQHTANIAAGDSYDATFTMRVPAVESGMLRVFVVTDATEKVMEADDTNNRLMSTNAATLSPFYMNTTDLAALRQLYDDLGGDQWNGTKWTPSSELITDKNWSGVTFNTDGRVTAINLQGRNLTGSFSVAVPYVATMSQLKSLNLSRNALTGDPATFLSGVGSQLTAVDMSYNRIYELSAPLPTTITALSLGYQNRQDGSYREFPGFDSATPVDISFSTDMTPQMPTLMNYNHSAQAFTAHPDIKVWKHRIGGLQTLYGTLKWSATNECYAFSQYSSVMSCDQDELVHLRIDGGTMAESSYPATIHFIRGDANSTGFIDVNDVQTTLNYIINSGSYKICLWAANTWTDNEAADLINIQDIVSTVNIVLENQDEASAPARRATMGDGFADTGTPAACFYAQGRYLMLDASEPVASFDVELRGVRSDQVRLLLPRSDWQMQTRNTPHGVRLVVFSPTGASLPVVSGQQLLRLSADYEPLRADASSPDAEAVTTAVGGSATGIIEIAGDDRQAPVYDLGGRRIADESDMQRHSIYIRNGKKIRR